jgi:hypothetical protein
MLVRLAAEKMLIDYFVQIIPSELFREISEYLKEYGLFCLLNTTKKFQTIKYECRKIVLQNWETSPFLGSPGFRKNIYDKIQDPRLQLKISSSCCELSKSKLLEVLQIPSCELWLEIGEDLHEVPNWIEYLKNRRAVELRYNDKITHFDGLSSTMVKLSLVSFTVLTNLNGFQNLSELSLRRSAAVEDVSCLFNLKKLNLEGCPKITDVSSLGNIYNLSIIGCTGIKDIDGLKNNFRLTVLYCRQLNKIPIRFQAVHVMTDLVLTSPESLNLKKLLHFHLVRQHSCLLDCFGHLHTFSISATDKLTHVNGLSQVHTVIISQCRALEDLSGLGNNKVVKIASCSAVKDFQPLKNIFRVIIEDCWYFSESSHLSIVYHLSVTHCRNVCDVLGFAAVHHLELKSCLYLGILKAIEKVPVVEIFSCPEITINWAEVENEKIVLLKKELSSLDRTTASVRYLLIDDKRLETTTLLRKG